MSQDYGFKEIVPDVFICIADADTRAVMGAKTSRAAHLEKRWEELMDSNGGEMWPWGQPPEMVSKFLDTNLKEYMHSSIAEMAEVFVYGKGIGWPSAWLLEDSPLFVGQEVSTRAVDVLKGDREPCKFSDPRLHELHFKWVELFEKLKKDVKGGGYKFDEIRWALPGTTRAGVTMCNKVRDGVRQLEMISGLGEPFTELAEQMLEGFKAYAPRATEAVIRGPRTPSSLWNVKTEVLTSYEIKTSVHKEYTKVKQRALVGAHTPRADVARKNAKTYLDPSWNFYGPFEVDIYCSISAARDWHRHRAVMPWELTVLLDEEDMLIKSPFYDMSEVSDELWKETSEKFLEILNDPNVPGWTALHALPFGATVKLRCLGNLPAILYMFELRYSAGGVNNEYKSQALLGLMELAGLLGPSISVREDILGVLSKEDRRIASDSLAHFFK